MEDKVTIDDGLRWLGSRKPLAFVYYGLFLLEISISALIGVYAYDMFNDVGSQQEEEE